MCAGVTLRACVVLHNLLIDVADRFDDYVAEITPPTIPLSRPSAAKRYWGKPVTITAASPLPKRCNQRDRLTQNFSSILALTPASNASIASTTRFRRRHSMDPLARRRSTAHGRRDVHQT